MSRLTKDVRLRAPKEILSRVERGVWQENTDEGAAWIQFHDWLSPKDWKQSCNLAKEAFDCDFSCAIDFLEVHLPDWEWKADSLPQAFTIPPKRLAYLGEGYADGCSHGYASRCLLQATLVSLVAISEGEE